jgi:hydrogenase nickel incorporation protein HypA/HybF
MHELSIAMSIVELALEEIERRGQVCVNAIYVKVGALAGVVSLALSSAYEIACEGTSLQGSALIIETVPVTVLCPQCQKELQIASLQLFCCPLCQTPTADIRQGRELEVVAMEIEECKPSPA